MTTSRELIDLGGIWKFQLDSGTGFAEVWNFADFQTSQGIFRVQGNKKGVSTGERTAKNGGTLSEGALESDSRLSN
jgi:hypothetical protein